MPSPKRWYRRFFGLESAPRDSASTKKSDPTALHRLASVGLELAGGVLLFAGGGYLLDRWLDTVPWLLVAGAVLGLAGGFYRLIRTVQEVNG